MKKIIIIDGNSLAYSRIPDVEKMPKETVFASTDSRNIFIVRKFIKKILRYKFLLYNDYKIIVIFDEQNKFTFRHEMDERYKSKHLSEKRQEQKNYVYKQIDEIKKILKFINIPYYSSLEWEADDIIGMLINKFEKRGILSTIVSGDKDILQLISGKTRVEFILPNENTSVIVNRSNVWDVSGGVWPDQIIEMKMLAGDSSDNIKGIGLIKDGRVNYWTLIEASEHIKKWGSIDNMYKNIEKLNSPYRESLKKAKDKLEFNKKMVTIIKDWQIDVDLNYFLETEIDNKKINEVIEDLNLQSMKRNKRFLKNIS